MSELQHTLTACSGCKRGYRARHMHTVEDHEDEDGVYRLTRLCESCYRQWCGELDRALGEVGW